VTHAVDGIRECLGVLQELLSSGLEDCKISLIIVEFHVTGLWWVEGERRVISTRHTAHNEH